MTEKSLKHKAAIKQSNANMEFETFLKNQQNMLLKLKNELKSATSEIQLSHCGAAEREKCILELEQSIKQHEAEIKKLRVNVGDLKEENSRILLEFNFFKEKYYQLETDYDRNLKQQKQETQEVSIKCEDLQQQLQDKMNDFSQLNKMYEETLQDLKQTKISFQQQQKEFELYKTKVAQDKRLNEEKCKIDFNNLQDELKQKDEILKKCISDKNLLEKEKKAVIDELNHKIQRIESAFSQPTKAVQPLPQIVNDLDNNSNSEVHSSNVNSAVSIPRLRNSLGNQFNKENQQAKKNQTQSTYKFPRPIQPTSTSQQSNMVTNRKRKNQQLRKSTQKKTYAEFSLSSSDENDEDDSSDCYPPIWSPNKDCDVAETDTSEGFAKFKHFKN